MGSREGDLVLIGWAYGATDIAFVHATFDAAGIPVFVHGAAMHATMTHAAVAMGGARVMVFRADVEAAVDLLENCQFDPAPRFGWRRIAIVLTLALLFGGMPMPFRAVIQRDLPDRAVPRASP